MPPSKGLPIEYRMPRLILEQETLAENRYVNDPQKLTWDDELSCQRLEYGVQCRLGCGSGPDGTAYFWGRIAKNERMRETGVLATEAMIDVLGPQYALRYSMGRLSPQQSQYQNIFFQGGTSFRPITPP